MSQIVKKDVWNRSGKPWNSSRVLIINTFFKVLLILQYIIICYRSVSCVILLLCLKKLLLKLRFRENVLYGVGRGARATCYWRTRSLETPGVPGTLSCRRKQHFHSFSLSLNLRFGLKTAVLHVLNFREKVLKLFIDK